MQHVCKVLDLKQSLFIKVIAVPFFVLVIIKTEMKMSHFSQKNSDISPIMYWDFGYPYPSKIRRKNPD